LKHIELNNEMFDTFDKTGDFAALAIDKEAVAEFMREVDEKTLRFGSVKERIDYLIENDFYENLYEYLTLEQIEYLTHLAYAYGFEFQSYMAASKFYNDYAMKTNDKKQYLERYEDRVVAVAISLGRGDFAKTKRYVESMMEQRYQPATPTFLNAGKSRRGEMVSCFLLEMDDSLNSIGFNVNTAMQLSKIGGGVAINLSKLRGRGEAIKEIENAASGVMPVIKLLEDSFNYANQLGQRKGAGAVYINIMHWDVLEVLDGKKINADEKSRIQTLSIGLIAPSKFFELAEKDEPLYVFAPYTVYKKYGQHLDDMNMDEMYDVLVADPDVKKRVVMSARDMLNRMAMTNLESGYPYLMFKDNANNVHPLKEIGSIKMSNLCSEIFQIQETSEINDYGVGDIIRRDISCNLGSLNIVNVMDTKKVRESVHAGIEALTSVSDMTTIQNAPTVKKANEELHSVGLGAMNLHGYLAKNDIGYESKEAIDFARTFFMMMNYYSIEKSMEIAKERGETFKDFEKSEYANGNYFDKYLTEDFSPRTEKVRKLFEGISIPSTTDWFELKGNVQFYGLYNAYRLAIAPTQSIGYVQNATQSVMPVTSVIETRTYGNSTTYYPMPFLSETTYVHYYRSAYDRNMLKLIDLIAEIQQHVDQGISTILYVNSDVSTADLARYYVYAHKKGLKSLYYTRTRNLSASECTACAI